MDSSRTPRLAGAVVATTTGQVRVQGFTLCAGPALPSFPLHYWACGPAAAVRALERGGAVPSDQSVVLVVHALTGDADVKSWWGPVVGRGAPLDPERDLLLCFNNLGSCYGSFGPEDPAFPRAEQAPTEATGKGAFAVDPRAPAPLSTWDLARAILLGLDVLGVKQVELATGGSVGGMLVFCLAMLAPDRFLRLCPIASALRATPWMQGWNHIGRMAVLSDPSFPESTRGLELARQVAHMSYRAEPGLAERHGAVPCPPSPLSIQTYLEHQGRKLVKRFAPLAYLAQLSAMDHHDVTRSPPSPSPHESWRLGAWGLERLEAPTLLVGIDSDMLFFPSHLRDLAPMLAQARYAEITSPHGHDAFLIEWDQMRDVLSLARAM